MTQYRRCFVKGGCYFFTVNAYNRNGRVLTDNIKMLRAAFKAVRSSHPFEINAIVVLPEHLHCILTLPEGDKNFSLRWRLIKSHFSRALPHREHISQSRKSKGERGVWQRRFWEHLIRNEDDYKRHVDYIHYNPVKHNHCSNVSEWLYSSFHKYLESGVYTADWGGGLVEKSEGEFGE